MWHSVIKIFVPCPQLMEDKFAVERRACIDQENNKWIKSKWSKGLNAETVNVIAGNSVLLISNVKDTHE